MRKEGYLKKGRSGVENKYQITRSENTIKANFEFKDYVSGYLEEIKEPKPYYIADIGANHDGDLNRALMLIELAKESGAHAAKFQNFKAETIVSGAAFGKLSNASHQSNWKSLFTKFINLRS